MKKKLRALFTPVFPVLDIILSPFTLLASILLYLIRKFRIRNMPVSRLIFEKVGVFPIVNHYYEPLFVRNQLRHDLDQDRVLAGIDWNVEEQLQLLKSFTYQSELSAIPFHNTKKETAFFFENPSLGPGDAEYLYCAIRHFKPKRIVEIGSGHSTLMAIKAVKANTREDASSHCEQICIEPYEMPWLEQQGVKVMRNLVENVDKSIFLTLKENDILFIDSSHMVRPQGDVLFEFLEVLPILAPGVIIHIHDIFSPRDYTKQHIIDDVLFWNEQYILEAFLTCNKDFRIIGALNYLKHHHEGAIHAALPVLKVNAAHEPGSFWIKRN
jgi:predicted O-methyltransferase YrrM